MITAFGARCYRYGCITPTKKSCVLFGIERTRQSIEYISQGTPYKNSTCHERRRRRRRMRRGRREQRFGNKRKFSKQCIHWFIALLLSIRWALPRACGIHSTFHPFIHSSIHTFIHPFVQPFMHSFHSSFHPFIHHPFIHSSIHAFIHPCIHPSIHATFPLALIDLF